MSKGWPREPIRHSLASKGIRTKVEKDFKYIPESTKKEELVDALTENVDIINDYPQSKEEIEKYPGLLHYGQDYGEKVGKIMGLDNIWFMGDPSLWKKGFPASCNYSEKSDEVIISIPTQLMDAFETLDIERKKEVIEHFSKTILHELLHAYDSKYFDGETIGENYIADEIMPDTNPFTLTNTIIKFENDEEE